MTTPSLVLLLLAMAAPSSAQTDVEALFALRGFFGPGVIVRLDDLDLRARDAEMATPLHRVAETTGDPELIRAMLARGAAPNARDAAGRTPLHYAAAADAPPGVLAALLGGGADADAADARGETPLHVAATAQAAGLLTLAGADPCATDARGRPALSAETLERLRQAAPDAFPVARAAFLSCL